MHKQFRLPFPMHTGAPISITALRQRLFKVTEQIAKTGVPVEFIANHQVYVVQLKEAPISKLGWLENHALFQSQRDILSEQGYEWTEADKINTP